ncbi:MAG: DeoR/GlpR transcriptional regulator [Clostridia bacterium]|nr:DeoR/GlpR transcriptional regulator [Clostridia bacterium]
MLIGERQRRIIDELKNFPDISVKELAQKLYVSEPTIRRDLTALHNRGIITKMYGGAVLNPANSFCEIPFSMRISERSDTKQDIARRAAERIEDGMTIMLDGSTSAYHMVPHLAQYKNLVVITSGARTAVLLAEANIRTFCTGGQMIIHSYSYVGEQAEDFIRNFNADILFFSCHGLDREGRMTDNAIEEANLRKVMLRQADKKILLCDSGKIGKRCIYNMGSISEVDEVISDALLPADISAMIGRGQRR